MQQTMANGEFISVVVPAFNEEGNIPVLYERVKEQLESEQCPFEIVFVDDGSRDRSLDVIRELHEQDERVKAISFSRNFGHQIALAAGIEHAGGDAVIVMDADLQHPPELIPQMLNLWKEGNEVVFTVKEANEGNGLFKRMATAVFYGFARRVTDSNIVPNASDFRLMDRRVVKALCSMRERTRFMRGMVSWVGFQQAHINYTAAKRHDGAPKYNLARLARLALDGITSFSTFPLRVATYLGFVSAFVGLPYGVWAVLARIFWTDAAPEGWASLLTLGLFLGGVQLICLGIIGEYIGKIYEEVKCRPLYITRDSIGFSADDVARSTSRNGKENLPGDVDETRSGAARLQ